MTRKQTAGQYVVFALGLITLFTTIFGVWRHFSPIPYADSWDGTIAFYSRAMESPWRAFFEQHNEHRLVFSRLIFFPDVRYFGGRNVLSLIANLILAGLLALSFLRIALHHQHALPRASRFGLAGTVLMFVFSWMQQDNFAWGFQSQWFAIYLFALLAFYALQLAAEESAAGSKRNGLRWFVVAIVTGIAAACSMASGLLVWPVLILQAFYLRLRLRAVVALLAIAAAVWLAFFMDWHAPPNTGKPEAGLLEHPVLTVRYALMYLGSPAYFARLGEAGAYLLGVFVLATLAVGCTQALQRRKDRPHATSLLAFAIFIAGNALITASGRLVIGMDTALSSRYTTASLTCALALLIFVLVNSRSTTALNRAMAVTLLAVLAIGSYQRVAFKSNRGLAYERMVAGLALRAHLYDNTFTRSIYPDVSALQHDAVLAETQRISIYAPAQPDYPVVPEHVSADSTCRGAIDHVTQTARPDLYRATGWIFDNANQRVPHSIVITDSSGVSIGEGVVGGERGDVRHTLGREATYTGWTAIFKVPADHDIRVAGLMANTTYCKITPVSPLPPIETAPSS